jgi:hypothetical protein
MQPVRAMGVCVSDKIIRTGWDVRGLVVVQFIPLRYDPYDFRINRNVSQAIHRADCWLCRVA